MLFGFVLDQWIENKLGSWVVCARTIRSEVISSATHQDTCVQKKTKEMYIEFHIPQ